MQKNYYNIANYPKLKEERKHSIFSQKKVKITFTSKYRSKALLGICGKIYEGI